MCLSTVHARRYCVFFVFNDTATTEIYTLSLHDALPIFLHRSIPKKIVWRRKRRMRNGQIPENKNPERKSYSSSVGLDRKSTRLNSSHANISYAVFCLKKKNRREDGTHVPSSDLGSRSTG